MAPSPTISGPRLLTLDEVIAIFPANLRPSKAKLEEVLVEHGCYREVFGKKCLTEADVGELLEHMRARPTHTELVAKLGPGRLFNLTVPKSAPGYMLFIGDQLGGDETVWIGFAPEDGVRDMLRLVQFGSPYSLAILHFFPATPADVEAHIKTLSQWRYRSDTTNWYMRSKHVNAYIQKLRDDLYGAQAVEADEPTSGEN